LLEAVSILNGDDEFTDHPQCVGDVLGRFLRTWNDYLHDDERRLLKPFGPRLIGTAGSEGDEQRRRDMCTDWLVREAIPMFIEASKLPLVPVDVFDPETNYIPIVRWN